MLWSKVKKQVENKFTNKLKNRIRVHITSYGHDIDVKELYNRGWITVDGKEVANFSTPEMFKLNRYTYHHATPTDCYKSEEREYLERTAGKLSEKGEFSKFDLADCCYAYLEMSIEEAVSSNSPIIKMLSVLDQRLGKRRLIKLNDEKDLHPIVRYFLEIRLEAENILNTSYI